jgi:hypothetical protein
VKCDEFLMDYLGSSLSWFPRLSPTTTSTQACRVFHAPTTHATKNPSGSANSSVCASSTGYPILFISRHLDHLVLASFCGCRAISPSLGFVGDKTNFIVAPGLVEHRPQHSTTVHMVVDNRSNRRVSALVRVILGHDALGCRGPKNTRRDFAASPRS